MPETYIQQPSTANFVPEAVTNCEHVPGVDEGGGFDVVGEEDGGVVDEVGQNWIVSAKALPEPLFVYNKIAIRCTWSSEAICEMGREIGLDPLRS